MIFLFENKLDPTINIRYILIFNFDLVQSLCNQVIKKFNKPQKILTFLLDYQTHKP